MNEAPDELTLMDYLSGSCSPEQAATVRAWIAQDPSRAVLLERLARAWNPPAAPEFDPGDRLRRRLRAHLLPAGGGPRVGRLVGLAAAMLVMVGGGALLWLDRAPARSTDLTGAGAGVPMREIATPRGQRAAFALGDGTRVMLDAESRLRMAPSYPSGRGPAHVARDLYLVGRAYFQVAHDSTSAFRVHTAAGVIEDLGTAFVVSAYPDRSETEVVVAEGKVAVHSVSAPAGTAPIATLARGAMAQVGANGLARLTDGVDLASRLAWTEGRHVFKHTRLGDAVAELARWYDVEIVAADPRLLERRFTASFENDPLPQVLEVLSVALDVRVERRGRAITLVPLTHRRGES